MAKTKLKHSKTAKHGADEDEGERKSRAKARRHKAPLLAPEPSFDEHPDTDTVSMDERPAVAAPPAPAKHGRGRPAKPKDIPPYITAIAKDAQVVMVKLFELDLADTTFRFRLNLRVNDLVESLKANGQVIPVILRRLPGRELLQVISGFRRILGTEKIGWEDVAAIILDDISDEQAFRISLLENETRKNYSDLERAYAIQMLRKFGKPVGDIAVHFKRSRRQIERIQKLLQLPPEVQAAIDDEGAFTASHALTLKLLRDQHGVEVDYAHWIEQVETGRIPVSKMKSAIQAKIKKAHEGDDIEVWVASTDRKTNAPRYRFRPVSLDPSTMTASQKAQVAADLRAVISALGH